jgi:hypothetical protein
VKPVHFATCVWGPWHMDMLTRITWPCLIAERNLPRLMRECSGVYRICTTQRDKRKLQEMEIFRAIAGLVPVEFVDTPTESPEIAFHMKRFFTALQDARREGAIFFNVWPDVIFTDCTLGNAARLLGQGRAGCVLPTLRVVSETCATEVLDKFSSSHAAPMAIPAGEAVRLGIRHMHPLSMTSFADAIHGRPETGISYRVPGEGMVLRSSFQWLFVDPNRIVIPPQFPRPTTDEPDPGRLVHVASDSDEMFFLSLAPLSKELEIFRPHHAIEAIDVARTTTHPRPTPFFDVVDGVCTRLHYGPMAEEAWRPVVRRSEAVFRRVRMLRALMCIWQLLKDHQCLQAARLISVALFTLKLPHNWLISDPVTIFVPTDAAIQALPQGNLERLLDRKSRRFLLRTLLSHVVPGTDSIPAIGKATHRAVDGSDIHIENRNDGIRVNGVMKVLDQLRSGPHRICVVDGVLQRDSGSLGA